MIKDGINLKPVDKFDLKEFINKIKLSDDVVSHLQYTEGNLGVLLGYIENLDENKKRNYMLMSLYHEYRNSFIIEGKKFDTEDIKNLFFEDVNTTDESIIEINNYVMEKENKEKYNSYRNNLVWVTGKINGEEIIHWYAPEVNLLSHFMKQFIEIYREGIKIDGINNPILESSLIHLLFVRIHPFKDGNGRTARILHNIKFTNCINKYCGTNFNFCPLNLSASILINKATYVDRINNIYFGLDDDDNNKAINRWFDFILDMIDEQINYFKYHVANSQDSFEYDYGEEEIYKKK